MIKARLKKIIFKLSKKKTIITDSKDLVSSQILDSLSIMMLISEIEKQFKIKVKMSKFSINDFKSVNTIEKYIKRNAKNNK
tara:strand:+ start:321 stop:563 length:243 start_codon:yes stop_codon:yes gene_type:complete